MLETQENTRPRNVQKSWLKRPGGTARFKKELAFLRQRLNPSRLNTYVTANKEVVFEIESDKRPGLTFYIRTGLHYPYVEPHLLVEENGQEIEINSPTLHNWTASRALYEICLDAEPVSAEAAPARLWSNRKLFLAGTALIVTLVGLIIVKLGLGLAAPRPPAPQPTAISGSSAPPPGAALQTRPLLPYELNLKVVLNQSDFQSELLNSQQDASLAEKYHLLVVMAESPQTHLGLRFINQTSGRVRSVALPDKPAASLLLDPADIGFQSGDTGQFVITSLDGTEEYSEPNVISRVSLDRFYIVNIKLRQT